MKQFQNRYTAGTENARKYKNAVQKERLCALIDLCEYKGEKLDWELMNTLSREELYKFYKDNIHVSSEKVKSE